MTRRLAYATRGMRGGTVEKYYVDTTFEIAQEKYVAVYNTIDNQVDLTVTSTTQDTDVYKIDSILVQQYGAQVSTPTYEIALTYEGDEGCLSIINGEP
jgi:hypothetical protein